MRKSLLLVLLVVLAIVPGLVQADTAYCDLQGGVWDAHQADIGGTTQTQNNDMSVGNNTWNRWYAGAIPGPCDIPQGATINSAYLNFTYNFGNAYLYVAGEDEDNSPSFSNTTNNITSRVLTTANTTRNITSTATDDDIDVTTIVQEIVDRPGWVANNTMGFMLWPASPVSLNAIVGLDQYELSGATATSLYVTYTPAAAAANQTTVSVNLSDTLFTVPDYYSGINTEYSVTNHSADAKLYYSYGLADTGEYQAAVQEMYEGRTRILRTDLPVHLVPSDLDYESVDFLNMSRSIVRYANYQNSVGNSTKIRWVLQKMPLWISNTSAGCTSAATPTTCPPSDYDLYAELVHNVTYWATDNGTLNSTIDSLETDNEPYSESFELNSLARDAAARYPFMVSQHNAIYSKFTTEWPTIQIIMPSANAVYPNMLASVNVNLLNETAAYNLHAYGCGDYVENYYYCDQYIRENITGTIDDAVTAGWNASNPTWMTEWWIDNENVKKSWGSKEMIVHSFMHAFAENETFQSQNFYYLPLQSDSDEWGIINSSGLNGGSTWTGNYPYWILSNWSKYHISGDDYVSTTINESLTLATASFNGTIAYMTVTNQNNNTNNMTLSAVWTQSVTNVTYVNGTDVSNIGADWNDSFAAFETKTYKIDVAEQPLVNGTATFYANNIVSNASVTSFTVTVGALSNTSTNPTLSLDPGNYTATFSKSGYYDMTVDFEVSGYSTSTNATFIVHDHVLNISVTTPGGGVGDYLFNISLYSDEYTFSEYQESAEPNTLTSYSDTTSYGPVTSNSVWVTLKTIEVDDFKIGEDITVGLTRSFISVGAYDRARALVIYSNGSSDTSNYFQWTGPGYSTGTITGWDTDTEVDQIAIQVWTNSAPTASATLDLISYEVMNVGTLSFNVTPGNWTAYTNDTLHSLTAYTKEFNNSVNFTDWNIVTSLSNTLNLTFYNETTNEQLTGVTVTYSLISDGEAVNGTTTNGSVTESLLEPGDYEIVYYVDPEVRRSYFVTLTDLSASNVRLYTIDDDDSNLYLPTVTDSDDQACSAMNVSLMRYYVDINGYRVVEMAQTDTNGQAVLHVQPNEINYKLYFQGACGTFTTQPQKIVASTDGFTVTGAQGFLTSSIAIESAGVSLEYINATQTYVFTWADASNIVTSGCLYVYKKTILSEELNYSECSDGSVGSLIYTLTGNLTDTEWSAQGVLDTSTTYSSYNFRGPDVSFLTSVDNWGVAGVFWGLILLLAIVLTSAHSASAIVFSTIGTLAVLITLGIVAGTGSTVGGLLIIGGVVLYKIKSS